MTCAQVSPSFHHQNASSFYKKFCITQEQTCQIVHQCPQCVVQTPASGTGVNLCGFWPNQVWQMDVTHFSQFGKQFYIHIIIDSCYCFILGTAHMKENTHHVISLLSCFAVLRCPLQLKTGNASAYACSSIQQFCDQFHINHQTGIPYNP